MSPDLCFLCPVAMLLIVSADGTKDEKDGYSIVVVKATGHHTGQAFSLPTVDAPLVSHTHCQAYGQAVGSTFVGRHWMLSSRDMTAILRMQWRVWG